MPCDPEELRHVPLFALLDEDEAAILAAQVEIRKFSPRQRIYKIGDPGSHAYVMIAGSVQVSTVDEDQQEVVIDLPGHGEFFGFASMLEQTAHQTSAMAMDETTCIEVDRNDISVLLQRKPLAGMDMLTVLGRQFHASQQLVRMRASRNPNDIIDEEATFGNRNRRRGRKVWRLMALHHLLRRRHPRLHGHQYLSSRQGLGSLSLHPA